MLLVYLLESRYHWECKFCEWVGGPNTGSCYDDLRSGGGPPHTPPPPPPRKRLMMVEAYGDKDTCQSARCIWGGGRVFREEKCV